MIGIRVCESGGLLGLLEKCHIEFGNLVEKSRGQKCEISRDPITIIGLGIKWRSRFETNGITIKQFIKTEVINTKDV